MNQAGIVLVAVAGLWIAYLVPHRSRYRQQLLESRADDRFSENLRVLRVAHAAGTRDRRTGTAPGTHRTTGVRLHPARRGGGGHMDRPHGTTDRVVADAARRAAAERAQRVAHLARRRAAARRRALLTGVLLVAAVVGWVAVAATTASVLLGAVPTVGLVGVLGLGRAAVRAGVRADAQWAAGAGSRLPLPAATAGARTVGRAVRPSDARTEVLARVPRRREAGATVQQPTLRTGATRADAAAAAPAVPAPAAVTPSATTSTTTSATTPAAARPAVADAPREGGTPQRTSAWSPVPVPPPSYTLKPAAPRREPAPLPADEDLAASVSGTAAAGTAAPAAESTPAATPAARATDQTPATLDLDAILARRRASGE